MRWKLKKKKNKNTKIIPRDIFFRGYSTVSQNSDDCQTQRKIIVTTFHCYYSMFTCVYIYIRVIILYGWCLVYLWLINFGPIISNYTTIGTGFLTWIMAWSLCSRNDFVTFVFFIYFFATVRCCEILSSPRTVISTKFLHSIKYIFNAARSWRDKCLFWGPSGLCRKIETFWTY